MSSTFLGMETALRGLQASQAAVDTTGHNISNASTPGYSRQTAVLVTAPALPVIPGGMLGTGVTVESFQRIRDSFLDLQLRSQTLRQGSAQAQQAGLSQIEQSLNEPSDNGLGELLSNYWAAWQNVANAPTDVATRQSLSEAASSLANGFNTLSTQLTTIASQTTQQQTLSMGQVNQIGSQIASLNKSIQASELSGATPNDLLDKRDLLVDQLSALGNTTVAPSSGNAGTLGSVDVTFGGAALVTGNTSSTLALPLAGITSGQLAGMQSVVTSITDPTNGYLAKLNALASALASATNTQSAAGKDLNGNTGGTFFDVTSGSEAATIAVDPSILASPSSIAASGNGDSGDGSNALAMGQLQSSALVGGATIDTSYQQLVTQIGADSQQAQSNLDNSNALVQTLSNQRQSVSGVSLDEEMTNMLQFQRGYQACGRVMATMDTMISVLLSSFGG